MITISILPYQFPKIALLVTVVIYLSSLACLADPRYRSVASTPYDRQMTRVRPVLGKSGNLRRDPSLNLVNQWIADLRAVPYRFSQEWKTPAEIDSASATDCKGKAVALYQRMRSHGARKVRLVIGKRTFMSRKTHAWLEWTTNSGTYVLDPTINWKAARANRLGKTTYIPLYAYAGKHKYRAATGALLAKN